MATVAPSIKYDASNADNFANWISAIHSALTVTAGWAQTTDTGQAVANLTVSITNISRTTTVVTLSYASQGATYKFIVGQTITVATSGTFSPTASGTFVITAVTDSGTGTATLTYTTSTGTIASVADTGTIKLYAAVTGFINRIYKTTDALSSTAPIYVKVRYGRSTTGNVPWVGIQFGQGSDGSGNLTGITSTESLPTSTATAQGNTTFTSHLAGGTSWFAMELWASGAASGTTPQLMAVERSRDNTGAETDTYFSIMTGVDSSTVSVQTIFKSGTTTTPEVHWPVQFPAHAAFNNGIWTVPWIPMIGKMGNPHIGAVVPVALVSNLSTVTIPFYGVNHTLLCIGGPAGVVPFQYVAANGDGAWLMRYE